MENSLVVTKESAASSQLEAALVLWFNDGDPVSIHTLAAASNELFNAIGSRQGKPSAVQKYINSRPPSVRDRLRKAQNFFKHGHRDFGEQLEYDPAHGEILLLDSILVYNALHGSMTPIMAAFVSRYSLIEPSLDWVFPTNVQQQPPANLAEISRLEFLEKFLLSGTLRSPHV